MNYRRTQDFPGVDRRAAAPLAPIIRTQPPGSRRGLAGKKAGRRVKKADGLPMPPPTRPPSQGGDGCGMAARRSQGPLAVPIIRPHPLHYPISRAFLSHGELLGKS
jgi:hypothetical protein